MFANYTLSDSIGVNVARDGQITEVITAPALPTQPQPQPVTIDQLPTLFPTQVYTLRRGDYYGSTEYYHGSPSLALIPPHDNSEEYHLRALGLGFMRLFVRGVSLRFVFDNCEVLGAKYDYLRLRLPSHWPTIYLESQSTMGAIAAAAGVEKYDSALPLGWVRAEYTSRGKPQPVGVWSYERLRTFGEFVSLSQMLDRIATALVFVGRDYLRLPSVVQCSPPPLSQQIAEGRDYDVPPTVTDQTLWQRGYRFETIGLFDRWDWSYKYARWGAEVIFRDGSRAQSFPLLWQPQPQPEQITEPEPVN